MVLELLLILAGLDLIVTGATGHCLLHGRIRVSGDASTAGTDDDNASARLLVPADPEPPALGFSDDDEAIDL